MRYVVTGGAGFIGSAVCRAAIAAGASVLNLDKLTYAASLESLAEVEGCPRYAFRQADICDAAAVKAALADVQPDAILNLAAETHVDRSIDGPSAFVQTNMVGTATLLEGALAYWRSLSPERQGRFRFVQVSTDEVYGSLGAEGRFDENSRYQPNSPYAASKAGGDHLARAFAHTYGLPVVVSNCSNNYGPFQFPEKLIPLVILNAVEGRPLPVYGDGGQVRDWLHVEDHAAALLRLAARGRPGETYCIGARAERRNLDVVQAICAALDALRPSGAPHARLIAHVQDRAGHDRRYAIDPGKIESELGWRPRIAFEAGLRETVAWYLDHRAWWEPLRARYDRSRLGLAGAAA